MKYVSFPAILVAVVSVGVYSCGSPTTTEPEATNRREHEGHMENGDHDHGEHANHEDNGQSGMEKMKTELAKLSRADAASAEKQHFCPVSGEMLGTMGAPQKVDVNGQQVWICCNGCKDKLLANPDEYLAKLNGE